jgi:hypothetical protein
MHNASNAPAHSFSFMALQSEIIQPLGALKALASLRVSPDALRSIRSGSASCAHCPEYGRRHADVAHLLGAHLRTRESARL